ncbi:hypothetical protein FJ930_19665 [Mesorhizobium sp. B2-4-15]|uniref:DUF6074 family protein n=1 Tax=Mesorhizobium sp. B2-4-15 TaxID=2589934 RepID=UPI00114F2819|nr:DUF6074 family protein [Mesorhizobium sp. B2-4-15]TPK70188.1 hypothetical protein FJ930_19665 [Mesorhizobium sp. B2-4-15]
MEHNRDKTASLVPFPLCRNARLVRETIDILGKRNGAAADRFWRSTVRQQIGRLQVGGIHDRNVINDQIEKFALVVFDALRSSSTAQHDGDAA